MKLKWGESLVPNGWRIDKRITYDIKPEDAIVVIVNRFVNAYALKRALGVLNIEVTYRQSLAAQTVVYMLTPHKFDKQLVLRKELRFVATSEADGE